MTKKDLKMQTEEVRKKVKKLGPIKIIILLIMAIGDRKSVV